MHLSGQRKKFVLPKNVKEKKKGIFSGDVAMKWPTVKIFYFLINLFFSAILRLLIISWQYIFAKVAVLWCVIFEIGKKIRLLEVLITLITWLSVNTAQPSWYRWHRAFVSGLQHNGGVPLGQCLLSDVGGEANIVRNLTLASQIITAVTFHSGSAPIG